MTLSDQIAHRNILEILHFTTNRGLTGILQSGSVLSRRQLPQNKYLEHVVVNNCAERPEANDSFDKSSDWLDYVNLSTSEINSRFFSFSRSWHLCDDVWWALLAFDPEILIHDGVFFATTNNSYPCCKRESGKAGFESMFAPTVMRKSGWIVSRGGRPDYLPTCEQAEVLYPKMLNITFLKRIYVAEFDHQDRVYGLMKTLGRQGIEVMTVPEKFVGVKN